MITRIIFIFAVVFLASCGASRQSHYYLDNNGMLATDGEVAIVKQDWFSVDSDKYPQFNFFKSFQPPNPHIWRDSKMTMPNILKTDVWKIRYNIENNYIAQSDEYSERMCRSGYGKVNIFNKCSRSRDFGIWIDLEGNVTGGWIMLRGPKDIGFARDMRITVKTSTEELWPQEKLIITKLP